MESKLAQNIASKIDLNGDSLRYILQHFHLLSVSKNEVLIRGDQEQNQKMFFVEEGCLRIYFVNEEGIESTRHLIFENHFATALTNFITNEPSIEYIQALEDSQVYYISKSNFFKIPHRKYSGKSPSNLIYNYDYCAYIKRLSGNH